MSSYASARYGHGYIGTEHLLLALLEESDCVALKILSSIGVDTDELKGELTAYLEGMERNGAAPQSGSSKSGVGGKANIKDCPTLSNYGRDLTALAKEGKLDPIIGRENETERVVQILARRTKK